MPVLPKQLPPEEPIVSAIKNGLLDFCVTSENPDVEKIKQFIAGPAELDIAVRTAAWYEKIELMEFFLSHGADINHAAAGAVRAKSLELLDQLIKRGADKNDAIRHAAFFGSHDLVMHLLDTHNASIAHAIHGATQNNQQTLIDQLIAKGANKNDAIRLAAFFGNHDLVMHLLDIHQADIDEAIHGAAQNNQQTLIDQLIAKGADKNRAVHDAAFYGQHNLVMHLLDHHGGDINAAAESAVRGNHRVLLDAVIARGADKNSPVCYAAFFGLHDLVMHLLNTHSADIDKAMFGAAQNNQKKLVDRLIAKGANVNVAVHHAAYFGQRELTQHLLSVHKADINTAMAGASEGNKAKFLLVLKQQQQREQQRQESVLASLNNITSFFGGLLSSTPAAPTNPAAQIRFKMD